MQCLDPNEKIFLFGYSCKLFRDDEKARYIDQGKHLIPWMGDESLMIDRYDVRGCLYDLKQYESNTGPSEETLSEEEKLCDEERYRSLRPDVLEEQIYHEEELKRLHAAIASDGTYHEIGFSYENEVEKCNEPLGPKVEESVVELYESPPGLTVPKGMEVPYNMKIHSIIEKTALFVSEQGGQMEVIIKMKQQANPRFAFMHLDNPLYPYYKFLVKEITSGSYKPVKEKQVSYNEDDDDEDYLHPSLLSGKKENVPEFTVPSLNFHRSQDDSYSVLIRNLQHQLAEEQAAKEEKEQAKENSKEESNSTPENRCIVNYRFDDSYCKSEAVSFTSPMVVPPHCTKLIMQKLVEYVTRNGEEFEHAVKCKNDKRLKFLDPSSEYYSYYINLRDEAKQRLMTPNIASESVPTETSEQFTPSETQGPNLPTEATVIQTETLIPSENAVKQEIITQPRAAEYVLCSQDSEAAALGLEPQVSEMVVYGPLPKVSEPVVFGLLPQVPVVVVFGPEPQAPEPVVVDPLPQVPEAVVFGPEPQTPEPVVFGPEPQVPEPVVFGPEPQVPEAVAYSPEQQVQEEDVLGPELKVSEAVVFGPEPQFPDAVVFGPVPQVPEALIFGPVPQAPDVAPEEENNSLDSVNSIDIPKETKSTEVLKAEEHIKDKLLSASGEKVVHEEIKIQLQMEQHMRGEQLQQQFEQQGEKSQLQLKRKERAALFLKMLKKRNDDVSETLELNGDKKSQSVKSKEDFRNLGDTPDSLSQENGILLSVSKLQISANNLPVTILGMKNEGSSSPASEKYGEEMMITEFHSKPVKYQHKNKKKKLSHSKSQEHHSESSQSKQHRSCSPNKLEKSGKEKELPTEHPASVEFVEKIIIREFCSETDPALENVPAPIKVPELVKHKHKKRKRSCSRGREHHSKSSQRKLHRSRSPRNYKHGKSRKEKKNIPAAYALVSRSRSPR